MIAIPGPVHPPLSLILRKEARAHLRDWRLLTLAVFLLIVLGVLLVSSLHTQQRVEAERRAVDTAMRAQWDEQGSKNPHRGAHFGLYAFRAAPALASLDPGLLPFVGQALWLEPHRRNLPRFAARADEPGALRLANVTPAFVLIVLLPLLVLALGYDTVSRERESGTLRQLQGSGVAPTKLLLGKWLALTGALAAVLVPLLSIATLAMVGTQAIDASVLLRLLCWVTALLIYLGLLASLTVAWSALAPDSRTALLGGLAIWLLFAFVVPRGAAAWADRAVILHDTNTFWSAITRDYQRGLPGDGSLAERTRRHDQELLRQHGVSKVEELPLGINALRRLHRDAYAERVHEIHFARLWTDYANQNRIVDAWSWASPTLALRQLSMALAGTGLADQQHFEAQGETYRRAYTRAIDEWDSRVTRGVASVDDAYADKEVWRSVAPFQYTPLDLGTSLRGAALAAAALVAWAMAAALALIAAAKRVQP